MSASRNDADSDTGWYSSVQAAVLAALELDTAMTYVTEATIERYGNCQSVLHATERAARQPGADVVALMAGLRKFVCEDYSRTMANIETVYSLAHKHIGELIDPEAALACTSGLANTLGPGRTLYTCVPYLGTPSRERNEGIKATVRLGIHYKRRGDATGSRNGTDIELEVLFSTRRGYGAVTKMVGVPVELSPRGNSSKESGS
ncbi:hypothetical protein Q5752_001885 [Cryptotrichosporon argae]